ncbi:hypothetical protein ACN28S_01755 [Cystobacter fuscus]
MKELLQFGERTAGEAAMPRVRLLGIPLNATPEQVRGVLRRSNHTRHPVYAQDLDHIVGMVHSVKECRIEHRPSPDTTASREGAAPG